MAKSKNDYLSKLGRRDFMKTLGLGAGVLGLGAAGVSAAGFKDLDGKTTSARAERDLPFWVKEVDEPTVEIDWENMEIFPGSGAYII